MTRVPESRAVSVPLGRCAILAILMGLSWISGCAGAAPSAPLPLRYLIAAGEEDVTYTYVSVVRVRVPGHGICSGVLAGPHLVLTAAHCFCLPAGTLEAEKLYAVTQEDRKNSIGLRCSPSARISTTLYHPGVSLSPPRPDLEEGRPASPSPPLNLSFEGPVLVRIHEGYRFQTDARAHVITSEMDLAAVYLGGAFEGVKPGGSLPEREVRAAEFLTAAGYGPTDPQEKASKRHFGTARVLDLGFRSNVDRVFAFGKTTVPLRDVYALNGDSGGPCFREDSDKRRSIIGIMSHSVDLEGAPITLFTSTFHHREWIQRHQALSEQFAKNR